MKLLFVCVLAVAVFGGATANPIAIITDILDLALSVGNVVSGGCIYYREICTLEKSITALEQELKPKFTELDALDKFNTVWYQDLTDVLARNNDLSQQSGNLQFLVISITKRLKYAAQTYDRLASEFEANTEFLINTYQAEMAAIKQNAITKTIVLGVLDGSKLLYSGLKFTYKKLKDEGKIRRTTDLKTVAVKEKSAALALQPITNPRWYSAKQKYQNFKLWYNGDRMTKIRGYAKKYGVVVGSLFSLGVSVAVDVIQAKNMRNTMVNTQNELLDIKSKIDGHISDEKEVQAHFRETYATSRNDFADLSNVLGDSVKMQGVTPAVIKAIADPKVLLAKQKIVIDAYAKAQEDLQQIDLTVEVGNIIDIGVEFGDSLRRISYTIRSNGYSDVTEDQILRYIANKNPNLQTFDGRSLRGYRG